MKKTKVKMNKPAYVGMSILDISKMLMYKFWYDYVRQKYGDRVKQNGLIHLTMMKMIKDLFK